MKKRWDGPEDAVAFAKAHGGEVSSSAKLLAFPRHVGLKVLGVVDYLRYYGWLTVYGVGINDKQGAK